MHFISHSWHDKATARQLAAEISRLGGLAWLDESQIPPGGRLSAEIEKGIKAADCVVLIDTPASRESDWVTNEVEFAQSLSKTIVVVKTEGGPDRLGMAGRRFLDAQKLGLGRVASDLTRMGDSQLARGTEWPVPLFIRNGLLIHPLSAFESKGILPGPFSIYTEEFQEVLGSLRGNVPDLDWLRALPEDRQTWAIRLEAHPKLVESVERILGDLSRAYIAACSPVDDYQLAFAGTAMRVLAAKSIKEYLLYEHFATERSDASAQKALGALDTEETFTGQRLDICQGDRFLASAHAPKRTRLLPGVVSALGELFPAELGQMLGAALALRTWALLLSSSGNMSSIELHIPPVRELRVGPH